MKRSRITHARATGVGRPCSTTRTSSTRRIAHSIKNTAHGTQVQSDMRGSVAGRWADRRPATLAGAVRMLSRMASVLMRLVALGACVGLGSAAVARPDGIFELAGERTAEIKGWVTVGDELPASVRPGQASSPMLLLLDGV